MTVNGFTKLAFSQCKSSAETEKMRSLIAPLIVQAKMVGDLATRDWSLVTVPTLQRSELVKAQSTATKLRAEAVADVQIIKKGQECK